MAPVPLAAPKGSSEQKLLYYHFPASLRYSKRPQSVATDRTDDETVVSQWYSDLSDMGFDGIIHVVGYWFDAPEDIEYRMEKRWDLRHYKGGLAVNRRIALAKEQGLGTHFLLINLFQGGLYGVVPSRADHMDQQLSFSRVKTNRHAVNPKATRVKADSLSEFPYPDWRDDESWSLIVSTVRATARLAKLAGCRGVGFDLEPYFTGGGFGYARTYPNYTSHEISNYFRLRAKEIARAIVSEFPTAEVLYLGHAGAFFRPLYKGFLKGLSSVEAGGIYLFTESAYRKVNYENVSKKVYEPVWQFGAQNVTSPHYWKEKGGVALGTMPLSTYEKRLLSPQQLREQLETFRRLAGEYIWLYPLGADLLADENREYREVLRAWKR